MVMSILISDKAGNVAPVDGAPLWTVSDESLATIVAEADGLSASVTPTGKLGLCTVQVSADADLSGEVKTILGNLELELIGGDAVSVGAG